MLTEDSDTESFEDACLNETHPVTCELLPK